MKNATDTETMQRGATIAIGQAERKKTDTETGDTERKKRLDTSHLEGLTSLFLIGYERLAQLKKKSKLFKEPQTNRSFVERLQTLECATWNKSAI